MENKSTPYDYKSDIYKCTSYFPLAFIYLVLKPSVSLVCWPQVCDLVCGTFINSFLNILSFISISTFHLTNFSPLQIFLSLTNLSIVRLCSHKEFKIFICSRNKIKLWHGISTFAEITIWLPRTLWT